MEKNVLLVLVGHRRESAVIVQKTLTDNGCIIKTRLGLHGGCTPEGCTDNGLIFLELAGTKKQNKDLATKLNKVPHVKAELVALKLDDVE